MRAGSLFSGIGGIDLGLERAGWTIAFQAEADPYRREVLAERFPGVPCYADVREVAAGGGGRPEPGELGRDGHGPDGGRGGSRAEDGGGDRAADVRLAGERDEPRPDRGPAELRAGADGESHASGAPDLLAGGFPCQDLSVAGRRAGLDGERSGLFFEFARVIDAFRPRAVLLENVPGLLTSNGGRDFGVVLGTLADLGYGVGWRILDSRFFGVPQRRRRVFIVGVLPGGRAGAERAGEILAVGTRCEGHPQKGRESKPEAPDGVGGGPVGPLFPTGTGQRLDAETDDMIVSSLMGSTTPRGHRLGADEAAGGQIVPTGPVGSLGRRADRGNGADEAAAGHYQPSAEGVRRLTPVECERLQGFPDGWTDVNGAADSRRYAACGDAVTVNVAEWIGHRLMEVA